LNRHPDNEILRRSESYINDGITLAAGMEIPESFLNKSRVHGPGGITSTRLETAPTTTLEIHRSVIDMRTVFDRLFSAQAFKEDKVQIGWDFDLR
jgi:hypothetical protein